MKIVNLLNENESNTLDKRSSFADDVKKGLMTSPKRIPSQYFYDCEGSKFFQSITEQDEYYLTKTEFQILSDYADKIVSRFRDKEIDLIELGAGDGHKTKVLVDAFVKNGKIVNFYPIDISSGAMNLLNTYLQNSEYVNINAVVATYMEGLKYVNKISTNQKLILLLGSNIGNTDASKGIFMLKSIREALNANDFLLTGFDLKKDVEVLNRAYNDEAGYTRRFNLNILKRMNRELGANFDLNQFTHLGRYNSELGAMESFLISKINQNVIIEALGEKVFFKEFEPVHLEYSFKYNKVEILDLSKETGFQFIEHFEDEKSYFIDSLWMK